MLEGKRAYICSPLSASTKEGRQQNMEKAKFYLMQIKRLYHCRTFASHAHLPLMLDDEIPQEREAALQIGMILLALCDVLVVCGPHISAGMTEANRQIREALGKGEYRTDYVVAEQKITEPETVLAELADAETIDRTYSRMLSLLILNEQHKEDLLKRGLTAEQIEGQRYRSVPLFGIKSLVKKLQEEGLVIKGVPGFYEDENGQWTINFSPKNSGILIPILSMEGRIQGFQIRLDHVTEGRKYIWLSSVKFKNGVSSGSPVHVIGDLNASEVYLTEGALKGTIAHYLSGDTFVCVAGVNQYRNAKPVLEAFKQRKLQYLYEAYDMDKKMKIICDENTSKCETCRQKGREGFCQHKMQKRQIIQNGCKKVYEICQELSISMSRMVWDLDASGEWNGQIKGIDDYYYSKKKT